MGKLSYTIMHQDVVTGFMNNSQHTEQPTRDEVLLSLEAVKEFCPDSSNVYFLNGDIQIHMVGEHEKVFGYYKHNQ